MAEVRNMKNFALQHIAQQLYHIEAHDDGNGQLMQIVLRVPATNLPLLQQAAREGAAIPIEGFSRYGDMIGWNYGRFLDESIRDSLRRDYGIEQI